MRVEHGKPALPPHTPATSGSPNTTIPPPTPATHPQVRANSSEPPVYPACCRSQCDTLPMPTFQFKQLESSENSFTKNPLPVCLGTCQLMDKRGGQIDRIAPETGRLTWIDAWKDCQSSARTAKNPAVPGMKHGLGIETNFNRGKQWLEFV